MIKFIKKAFTKQIIWRVYVPLLTVTFGIILDRSIPKINIIGVAVDILIKILTLNIPLYIILIIILLAIVLYKIKKLKLNEEQKFILSMINERELGIKTLFIAYKKEFPNTSRTMSECIRAITKLENLKLVKLEAFTGGMQDIQDELFQITDKGRKRIRKMDTETKAEAEKIFEDIYYKKNEKKVATDKIKRLEPKKQMVYILEILANQLDRKKKKSVLRNDYFEEFRKKDISDFNYVWSILEKKGFVSQSRGTTGYGGSYEELPFYITDKGLEFYLENKNVLKD